MVRLLLVIVLMLAVLVLIGFVLGYNKIRSRRRPGGRGAVRYRRGADAPRCR